MCIVICFLWNIPSSSKLVPLVVGFWDSEKWALILCLKLPAFGQHRLPICGSDFVYLPSVFPKYLISNERFRNTC